MSSDPQTQTDSPVAGAEIGTPLDYSADVYRVYFEVVDPTGLARQLMADFLGSARAEEIQVLAHGYELELPIQCVPEIVRLLVAENIAVYQVVRRGQTNTVRT